MGRHYILKFVLWVQVFICTLGEMDHDGFLVPGLSFPESVGVDTMEVRGWELGGSAQVTSSESVVLTEDKQHEVGRLWTKNRAMQLKNNWDMEIKFKVVGESEINGDGFALWLTEKPMEESIGDLEAFGHDPKYKGLGIFFDSFRNNEQNKRPLPMVLARYSEDDQEKSYDHDLDGLTPELWTFMSQRRSKSHTTHVAVCAADFRFLDTHQGDKTSILQLSYRSGTLIITVGTPPLHSHLQPKWKQCGILKQVNFDSPDGYFFGFTGMTGEVTNRQEILDVSFYAVSDTAAKGLVFPHDGVEEAREVLEEPQEIEIVDEEIVISEGHMKEVIGEDLAELAAEVEDAKIKLAEEILKEKVMLSRQDAREIADDLVVKELEKETNELLRLLQEVEKPEHAELPKEGIAAEVVNDMTHPDIRKEDIEHIVEAKEHEIEKIHDAAQQHDAWMSEGNIDPQLLGEMEAKAMEEISELRRLEALVEEHEDAHVYEVSIPDGVEEGQPFQALVTLDSGESVMVDLHCPSGLVAGDFMRFRLPAPDKLEVVIPHEDEQRVMQEGAGAEQMEEKNEGPPEPLQNGEHVDIQPESIAQDNDQAQEGAQMQDGKKLQEEQVPGELEKISEVEHLPEEHPIEAQANAQAPAEAEMEFGAVEEMILEDIINDQLDEQSLEVENGAFKDVINDQANEGLIKDARIDDEPNIQNLMEVKEEQEVVNRDTSPNVKEPNKEPPCYRVGDRVICKYPPYRGRGDDPWFAGVIRSISENSASIRYDDGDVADNVFPHEIRYAPSAPSNVGKGSHRFNDLEQTLHSYEMGERFSVEERLLHEEPPSEEEVLQKVFEFVQENEHVISELQAFIEIFDKYKASNEALKVSSENLNEITERIQVKIEDFQKFVLQSEMQTYGTLSEIERKMQKNVDLAFEGELTMWHWPFYGLALVWLCSSCFVLTRLRKIEKKKGGLL